MGHIYAPSSHAATQDERSQWLVAASTQLYIIKQWLRDAGVRPTLTRESGQPVLRMTHVAPVERLATRTIELQDRGLPEVLQSCGRIEWMSEDGPKMTTPSAYASAFMGSRQCMLLWPQRDDGWMIYIPDVPRLAMISRSSIGTLLPLTRMSFAEVASALLAR